MTAAITVNQEYARLVPKLSKEEYESLKESIKQNGLWVPIIVNSQGVILDGHHRYKACQELELKNLRLKLRLSLTNCMSRCL
jgi:ParB-like chromosome segregation protein Spo0J